jgi:uncharacterized protein YecE (DUF72 family)
MNAHLPQQAELFPLNASRAEYLKFDAETTASAPIYIGCAGWALATSMHNHFPSEGTHLERYARVFSAVEINSSFYRPHLASTYARWRDSVPDAFRFSVKMPRSVTHHLRLKNADAEVSRFLAAVRYLDAKLGCLLVQLPPSLPFDPPVAESFFSALRASVTVDIACEPRHGSWAAPEADALFDQLKIARVDADPPAILTPSSSTHTDMVYVRLHGSPTMYHSAYSEQYLSQRACELAAHIELGRRVWCIMDNTASGAAIPNALSLSRYFEEGTRMHPEKQHVPGL